MPFVKGQVSNPHGKIPGTKNRATIARELFLAEQMRLLQEATTDINATAHSTLVSIYQSPHAPPQLKLQAASVAIKYEKPALSAQHVSGSLEVKLPFAEQVMNGIKRYEVHAGPTIDMLPGSAREVALSCTEPSS